MYSGYLAGCTVFLDSNKNGVLDADEAEATTTPYGRYELAVMEDLDLADKNVVVKTGGGCKDTSTDLDLAVEMAVKATCATGGMDSGGMVNLITAIQGLVAVDDISADVDAAADDAAKRRVIIGAGLALTADFDACKYDPLSAAWSASAAEQTAFANFIRTNVELTTLVKTLSDVTGYADEAKYNQASKAILQGIATMFQDFANATMFQDFAKPTWGRQLAAAGGLSVGSEDNIKELIKAALDVTSADIADNPGLVAQIASSTAAMVGVLAEQVSLIVEEVIAGQSANASGADISTIAVAMQDLAKCSVVSQDANTATKEALQAATPEEVADPDNTGALTKEVKAQLDARAGKAAFQLEMDAAIVPLPVQIPSPAPPPPPPSPSLPPPTPPPPSPPYVAPPPSTESVVLQFTASGSVSDWTTQDRGSVQRKIAAIAGTTASAVVLTVAAGSVLVTATIAVPASSTAAAVMAALSARLGSAIEASTALGINVVSVPTIREASSGVEAKGSKMMPMDLLALIITLLVLLPPMLGMAYALIRYRGQECKYLSYRLSHTNPNVNVGYMPKERRDALWAEITAGRMKTGTRVVASNNVKHANLVARGALLLLFHLSFTYFLPSQDRECCSGRLGLRREHVQLGSSDTRQHL